MDSTRPMGCTLVALFLFVFLRPLEALDQYYPTKPIPLYEWASTEIHLPCDIDAFDRAGSLVMSENPYLYPTWSFNFTVTVGEVCSGPTQYAIYLNFRKLRLKPGDYLDIHEGSSLRRRLLGGNVPSSSNPTSYGQLRSLSYSHTATFHMQFHRSSGPEPSDTTWTMYALQLDYIVLRADNTSGSIRETKCDALNGYILSKHFCETGDRVNCPYEYSPEIGYVLWTQFSYPAYTTPRYCFDYTTSRPPYLTSRPAYPTSLPDYSWRNDSSDSGSGLSRYAIVAIVFACISTLVMAIAVVKRMCRAAIASPPRHRQVPTVNPNQQIPLAPVQTGAYPGQGVRSFQRQAESTATHSQSIPTVSGAFMDAPPAYDSLYQPVEELPKMGDGQVETES